MMHGGEKSDLAVVAGKLPNKAGKPGAEVMEPRAGAKENVAQRNTRRTQSRESVPQSLGRIRQAAIRDKGTVFTALLHHVTPELLDWAFFQLKKSAAPGVDGVTWDQYEAGLPDRLADLHGRVQRGAYRALPSRRQCIPKPDGRLRPLGVAALEDKIVQRAVVAVLNAIYEADFVGFSYGFRPRRSQHDALDALAVGLHRRKVGTVLDADIRAFFDTISHDWLMRFLEHRIGDQRILRLIGKWLKAGVLADDTWTEGTVGTPQGAVISPLLANVYLHYVYDLWVQQWRQRHAHGDTIVIRYADDTIVGFQHEADARRFLDDLRERLAKFGLELHPEKTRLIPFGRYAQADRPDAGTGGAGNFRLPGVHAYLREKPRRQVPAQAADHAQTYAGQTRRDKRGDAAPPASAHSRTGKMAEKRRGGLLRLPRRADKRAEHLGVPVSCDPDVAEVAPAAQPTA